MCFNMQQGYLLLQVVLYNHTPQYLWQICPSNMNSCDVKAERHGVEWLLLTANSCPSAHEVLKITPRCACACHPFFSSEGIDINPLDVQWMSTQHVLIASQGQKLVEAMSLWYILNVVYWALQLLSEVCSEIIIPHSMGDNNLNDSLQCTTLWGKKNHKFQE